MKVFVQVCDLWAIAPLPYRQWPLETQKSFQERRYLKSEATKFLFKSIIITYPRSLLFLALAMQVSNWFFIGRLLECQDALQ